MIEAETLTVKTVAVGADEPLVLPDEFRRGLGLDAGGEYTVIQLNGFILLTPKRLISLELLEAMRRSLDSSGVTLDDLLVGLGQVRQEIYQERYGSAAQAA